MSADVSVRSIWSATRVPGAAAPYDTAHLRLFYPAAPTGTIEERMSGFIAADRSAGTLPVVLILSGINVGQDSYRWLAVEMVKAGFAAVTYDWVGELFPGQYGVTPGLDTDAVTPETYGTKPSGSAVAAVIGAVDALNSGGLLEGLLDTSRVALVGHSAGGTVVMQSASSQWFPQVRAAVALCAHTGVSTMLGWEPDTHVDAPVTCPMLLVGATEDGVMNASAVRYGVDAATRRDPIERTFMDSLGSSRDATYVVLQGANHFVAADPIDPTSARAFLDGEASTDPAHSRAVLVYLLTNFLRSNLCADGEASKKFDEFVEAPPAEVQEVRRRVAATN